MLLLPALQTDPSIHPSMHPFVECGAGSEAHLRLEKQRRKNILSTRCGSILRTVGEGELLGRYRSLRTLITSSLTQNVDSSRILFWQKLFFFFLMTPQLTGGSNVDTLFGDSLLAELPEGSSRPSRGSYSDML